MGYNETTLAQTSVFNFSPNGNEAAFGVRVGALSADSSGNLFLRHREWNVRHDTEFFGLSGYGRLWRRIREDRAGRRCTDTSRLLDDGQHYLGIERRRGSWLRRSSSASRPRGFHQGISAILGPASEKTLTFTFSIATTWAGSTPPTTGLCIRNCQGRWLAEHGRHPPGLTATCITGEQNDVIRSFQMIPGTLMLGTTPTSTVADILSLSRSQSFDIRRWNGEWQSCGRSRTAARLSFRLTMPINLAHGTVQQ